MHTSRRYVFSTYKTFGPHLAALYGRRQALDAVKAGGPNHYFVPLDDPVYKFELGSASHEGCAGLIALGRYLQHIAGLCRHAESKAVHDLSLA